MAVVSRNSARRLRAGASLALGLVVAACGAREVCLPKTTTSSAAAEVKPQQIRLYLDGSASMAGYASGSGDVRPLGDLIALVNRAQPPVERLRFGKDIAAIKGGAAGSAAYATPAAYRCRDCDNQESRIDAVLDDVARRGGGALSIVVTDLWLDNRAFAGSPQVALGGPLAAILKEGRAVGVIGIRAPYEGRITDLPSGGAYDGAKERPLFIIAAGQEAQVAALYDTLRASGSPAFSAERTRFALFSSKASPPSAGGGLRASGVGVSPAVVLPAKTAGSVAQFKMSLSKAEKGGAIEGLIDAANAVRREAVWSGPLKGDARVWVLGSSKGKGCDAAWTPLPPLGGAWRPDPGAPTRAILRLDPASLAALRPDQTYLVEARLGSARVASPNPAAAWMREWGFVAADEAALIASRPQVFKALNLGGLAEVMEAALNDAAPEGRTTTTVLTAVRLER